MTAMNINSQDAEVFVDKVSEVARLIEGLREGTISADYIDRHYLPDIPKASSSTDVKLESSTAKSSNSGGTEVEPDEKEIQRRAALMEKAAALKASYERKLKARAKFEQYVAAEKHQSKQEYGTDYTKWDMWCPEDEEDDLINSITPSNSAFKAMEKDIDERHRRMVESRQIAERQRVLGNEAFKTKQYGEALRCYQQGISSEKTNMALHGNAAMAALKLNCFVQAIEHCDKVIQIADFMHNNLKDPLCTKAYQRRATAYRATQQYNRAVQDLELAFSNDPDSKEIQQQLSKAKLDLQEYRKQKQLSKAMKDAAGQNRDVQVAHQDDGVNIDKLRQLEQLVQTIQKSSASKGDVSSSPVCKSDANVSGDALRGPHLPQRNTAGKGKNGPLVVLQKPALLPEVCHQVFEHLQDDDLACVYFRECGGLEAVAQVLISSSSSKVKEQQDCITTCLKLLNAACINDGNLLLLPKLKVLPAVALLLDSSSNRDTAAAAIVLLCTISTNEEVRQTVSKYLSTDEHLQRLLGNLQTQGPRVQGVALTLLGNCMVDAIMKKCMRTQLQQQPGAETAMNAGAILLGLVCTSDSQVQERALTLCANMCGDSDLRVALLQQQGLLQAVVDMICRTEPKLATSLNAEDALAHTIQLQLGAATLLYNISVEPLAQLALLIDEENINNSHVAKLLLVTSHCNMTLASRIAGVVARCFKHPSRPKYLPSSRHCELLTSLLERCLDSDSEQQLLSDSDSSNVPAAVDAVVRALALLTHDEGADGTASALHLLHLRAPKLLITIVRQLLIEVGQQQSPLAIAAPAKHTRESILGNAALCLGHLARIPEALPILQALDVVQPLVRVAYEGQGSTASKNAAIALARLSKNTMMMERLRELHGIEIIYQYVRP